VKILAFEEARAKGKEAFEKKDYKTAAKEYKKRAHLSGQMSKMVTNKMIEQELKKIQEFTIALNNK